MRHLNTIKNEHNSVLYLNDLSTFDGSCSVALKHKLFIYGSIAKFPPVYQISCDKTEPQKMSRLQFNFTYGSCSTNGQKIILCFSNQLRKQCYNSAHPIPAKWWQWFTLEPKSNFTHHLGSIAMSPGKLNPLYPFNTRFRLGIRNGWN